MISRRSHTTIFVENQNTALDFYTNKLGFKVETDMQLRPVRLLTLRARTKELAIALLDPAAMYDHALEAVRKFRELQTAGKLGADVFQTTNCVGFPLKDLQHFQTAFPLKRTIEFPDAGHFFFEDEAPAMVSAIRQFMTNHEP